MYDLNVNIYNTLLNTFEDSSGSSIAVLHIPLSNIYGKKNTRKNFHFAKMYLYIYIN